MNEWTNEEINEQILQESVSTELFSFNERCTPGSWVSETSCPFWSMTASFMLPLISSCFLAQMPLISASGYI